MKFTKRELLTVLILIIGLTVVLAGCGTDNRNNEPQSTWDKIKEKGEIVVGLDDAFPPFGYRNEKNELVGFDIELGEKIGEKLGIKFKWQPTAWNGVIMALKTKKFDIIMSGMSITEERKKEINFSEPYMAGAQVILVTVEDESIKSIKDLEGKVVGTQLGSTGQVAAEQKLTNLKELKTYDTFTAAYNDLLTGRLAAVVVGDSSARRLVEEKPDKYKIVEGVVLSYQPCGIGVRKEDKELLERLNWALQEVIKDGTYARLTKKWFGQDMTSRLEDIK